MVELEGFEIFIIAVSSFIMGAFSVCILSK